MDFLIKSNVLNCLRNWMHTGINGSTIFNMISELFSFTIPLLCLSSKSCWLLEGWEWMCPPFFIGAKRNTPVLLELQRTALQNNHKWNVIQLSRFGFCKCSTVPVSNKTNMYSFLYLIPFFIITLQLRTAFLPLLPMNSAWQ